MITLLDRQHFGKPKKSDLGAGVDLDGNGKVDIHEMEANLTPLYINPAAEYLELRGHAATILQEGYYSFRHSTANSIAASNPNFGVAYAACHFNAGGGSKSLVFYDARSSGGKDLAESIVESIEKLNLPGITKAQAIAARSDDWTKNAWYTIKGIYAGPSNISGVCFEPLFLDNPAHQPYLTPHYLRLVGQALAAGCINWNHERSR